MVTVRKAATVRRTNISSHYFTTTLFTLVYLPLSSIKYDTKTPYDVGVLKAAFHVGYSLGVSETLD